MALRFINNNVSTLFRTNAKRIFTAFRSSLAANSLWSNEVVYACKTLQDIQIYPAESKPWLNSADEPALFSGCEKFFLRRHYPNNCHPAHALGNAVFLQERSMAIGGVWLPLFMRPQHTNNYFLTIYMTGRIFFMHYEQ